MSIGTTRLKPNNRVNTAAGRRRRSIAFLVSAMLAAPLAFAQSHSRFGAPELYSPLGAPLLVKIPVEASDASDDLTLPQRYRLGPAPAGAGVPFIENAEITLERHGREFFLVIRSRQAVVEPAVGVVIREQLAAGSRSREFLLLPDPPNLFVVRDLPRSAEPPVATSAGAPSPAAIAAAPAATAVQAAEAPATVARPAKTARKRGSSSGVATTTVAAEPDSAAQAATAPARAPKARRAATKSASKGPRLSLSLSAGALLSLPHASEAERTELRLQQLMMDTDDLRSSLLERRDRIARLEKELADLSTRVLAAEQAVAAKLSGQLSTGVAPLNAQPVAATTIPPPLMPTATEAPVASAPATEPAAAVPPPASATPAAVSTASLPVTRTSWWQRLLYAVAGIAGVAGAFSLMRRFARSRDESFRLIPQSADDYVAEVVQKTAVAARDIVPARAAALGQPVGEADPGVSAAPVPEIHFELPAVPSHLVAQNDTSPAPDWTRQRPAATADIASPMEVPAAPVDELGVRRQRYLEARYHDIAILNPPLDAPQRLLRQASRLYDEGATDFAKRMLKYAAYSRPYTEEYWLALAELLYREKFSSDFVVNARWFRRYHTRSLQWEEIQRIGYLLDASEPMFANAASWSHDAPEPGRWLPRDEQPPATVDPFPALQLQLAS